MPVEEDPFRFLTMVEFNRLSRREKALYLERAGEEITRRQPGNRMDAALPLFKDAAP
jgi:hypothetical protein